MSDVNDPFEPLVHVTESVAESLIDAPLETAGCARCAILIDKVCFTSGGAYTKAENNIACSAVIDLPCPVARDM